MKSILEQLYEGEIYGVDRYKTTVKQHRKKRKKLAEIEERFLSKLDQPLREEYSDLTDRLIDLLPYESEEAFIDGFCLGARIILEVTEYQNNVRR